MTRMDLSAKLDPSCTAVLVIDIQNDFCSPSGLMASMGKDISSMESMIAKIQSLTDICHETEIPVFYTQQIYDRTKLTALQKEQYDLDGKKITCDVKGDGHQFYKLDPPSERVFPKYSYDVFSNADLRQELTDRNIKTLVITGVLTHICVETAIRNGFDIGYKIVVPSDLVATTSQHPGTQERTLQLVEKTYGVVVDSSEIVNIWEKCSRQSNHQLVTEKEHREHLIDLLDAVTPWDELEHQHLREITSWILSGEPLWRVIKPNVPSTHVVAYAVVIDQDKQELLLTAHRTSGLWLATGGHDLPYEKPWNAVLRECAEEFTSFQSPVPVFGEVPFFATVNQTVGSGSHTDISLWYVLHSTAENIKSLNDEEFSDFQWHTFAEILKLPIDTLDRNMHRFINKLMTVLPYEDNS